MSFEAYFGCHMSCGNMTSEKLHYDLEDYNNCLDTSCNDAKVKVFNDPNSKKQLDDFNKCR